MPNVLRSLVVDVLLLRALALLPGGSFGLALRLLLPFALALSKRRGVTEPAAAAASPARQLALDALLPLASDPRVPRAARLPLRLARSPLVPFAVSASKRALRRRRVDLRPDDVFGSGQ